METSSAIVLPRLRPLLAKDLVSSLLSTFFEMGMLRKVSLDGDATMEWGGRPWNPTVPMVNCVHLIIDDVHMEFTHRRLATCRPHKSDTNTLMRTPLTAASYATFFMLKEIF